MTKGTIKMIAIDTQVGVAKETKACVCVRACVCEPLFLSSILFSIDTSFTGQPPVEPRFRSFSRLLSLDVSITNFFSSRKLSLNVCLFVK